MVRKVISVIAMMAAAPALAGTPLWGKIEIDMPFVQTKAAYPEAHVHTGKGLFRPHLAIAKYQIDGCDAAIMINIDRKVADPDAKVESVRLSGDGCDAKMLTNLVAKYGEPAASMTQDELGKKTVRWVADGRTVFYKAVAGSGWGSDSWEIIYAPIRDVGL